MLGNQARPLSKQLSVQGAKQRTVYILECFKEVPGAKRAENPKHQIYFDLNEMTLKNVRNNLFMYFYYDELKCTIIFP